ncbi:MAG: hypothetical protein IE934_07330 [Sphingopyxis sp.]|nr:hypothetical protein [Sphingopyxis sp.]
MIEIRDFHPDDIAALDVQPEQAGDIGLAQGQIMVMAAGGPSFTALRDGRPIACAGLYENHAKWATAWAALSRLSPAELLAITRPCLRAIEASGYRRIDCLVRRGFPAARQWAWMLGFAQEGTMFGVWPDGSDALIFARIKGE